MKAYIRAGHGEHGDPGAVKLPFIEKQMTDVTAEALGLKLKEYGHTVEIELQDLEINDSARKANEFGADIMIDVHYNAGGGNRGEIIYSIREGSLKLAEAIMDGLKNAGQTEVRVFTSKNSYGKDYFGILRKTTMPAVIVEPCFIDNAQDVLIADTTEELKNIGYKIAESIISVYGGTKMNEWKTNIIYKAQNLGLIKDWHNPDDTATKWFVLQLAINIVEKYILKIK